MDSLFFLEKGDRTAFLVQMMESFGCTYICLWQYFQPSNCLMSLDGIYQGENEVARRLFEEYRHSWLIMDNGRVPGLALKNSTPYIELPLADLQSLASIPVQLQFYLEAGIKTAIFMGCSSGEIELGMSSSPQVNLETVMMNLFREDFTRQAAATVATGGLPQPIMPSTDRNRPSSSSSSLRSLLSTHDSPEYSSLFFNVATCTSCVPIPPVSSIAMPYQQANIQTLNRIGDLQFPLAENEDDAITRAYLAVISSHSSSSSSSAREIVTQKTSSFRRYFGGPNVQLTARTRSENMLKRSIIFYRNLNMIMRRQEQIQANRFTSTQVHHMISERKRREKINESFQQLRSLLPPGTKKDKASVLASTAEYLSSLKVQVEELSKKNEMLEAQVILTQRQPTEPEQLVEACSSGGTGIGKSLHVQITHVTESTSEATIVDLQVSVRGESSILLDMVLRLLDFLKTLNNVSIESVEANSRNTQPAGPVNHITLRLKIQSNLFIVAAFVWNFHDYCSEDGELDETAFQEAVKRVVGDSA